MAEEGYTIIFHPGEEGVTIHKQGTVAKATTEPPILQECKAKGEKLWAVSADDESMKKEQANNVYGLPSVKQSV
jgi:hypothetical protein